MVLINLCLCEQNKRQGFDSQQCGTQIYYENEPFWSSKDCLARINAIMSSSARLSPVKLNEFLPLDELRYKYTSFSDNLFGTIFALLVDNRKNYLFFRLCKIDC
jgi:hypothetical protein